MKKIMELTVGIIFVAFIIGCGGQKPAKTPQTPSEVQSVFMVSVKTLDTVLVVSKSIVGPYSNIGQILNELYSWLEKNKISPSETPLAIFMDKPGEVKPESTKFKVCIPVPPGAKGDEKAGIFVEKFGGMKVASTKYIGSYDKIGATYERLAQWISENNYQIDGPPIEFYLSDPTKTPPESLQTEVCYPVKEMPTTHK